MSRPRGREDPMDANDKNEKTSIQTASLLDVLLAFLKIGGTAFGGSTQALVYREVVENRRWLSEEQFLAGQAIAQVLPGANPVNLALYIGLQINGRLGAIAAVLGMVIPAFFVILAMGFAYREMSGLDVTHYVLGGVAAAAVGATLSMGFKTGRKLRRNAKTFIVAALVFVAIGLLRWPMIPVVIIAVPLSIWLAWLDVREAK
jgi:chromate transporter